MSHPLQQAQFFRTAATDAQLPPVGPPEIAFAGRSNAGKSSAINALANRTRLAFTSKTPGRTQQINFFVLRGGALLADLPGYGFAAVPRDVKHHWQDFLTRYIGTRQSLAGLVLVVDVRRGITALDLELLQAYLPSARPLLVLATKSDKLTPSASRVAERELARELRATFPAQADRIAVVAFSATRRIGIEEAERVIASWLGLGTMEPELTAPSGSANGKAHTKEKAPPSRGVTRGPKRPA